MKRLANLGLGFGLGCFDARRVSDQVSKAAKKKAACCLGPESQRVPTLNLAVARASLRPSFCRAARGLSSRAAASPRIPARPANLGLAGFLFKRFTFAWCLWPVEATQQLQRRPRIFKLWRLHSCFARLTPASADWMHPWPPSSLFSAGSGASQLWEGPASLAASG